MRVPTSSPASRIVRFASRARFYSRLRCSRRGGVAERSNAAVSKTFSGFWVRRGFKSLPLRSTRPEAASLRGLRPVILPGPSYPRDPTAPPSRQSFFVRPDTCLVGIAGLSGGDGHTPADYLSPSGFHGDGFGWFPLFNCEGSS